MHDHEVTIDVDLSSLDFQEAYREGFLKARRIFDSWSVTLELKGVSALGDDGRYSFKFKAYE